MQRTGLLIKGDWTTDKPARPTLLMNRSGARTCLDIDVPAGTRVHYGPFRELVTPPFDLDSQKPCQG